jgi:hypothetical protein
VNNKFKKIQKGAVIAYFEVLFWNLRGKTEENHKRTSSQDSECSSTDSKHTPPKYKTEALPLLPTCLVRRTQREIISSSSLLVNIYITVRTLASLTLLQITWIT